MTYTIPDAFIPKFKDEFKIRAQQMKRRLDGLAEEGGVFVGDEVHFPRFGSAETFKAQRLQELSLQNINLDWVKVRAEPEFSAFGIWDPDKHKLNANMAVAFAKASVRAVNRARDRQHIEALTLAANSGVTNTKGDTENIVTIGDYNTVADLETIGEAIVALGTNDMFEGEDVAVIAPFKLRVQNAFDPILLKTDVKGNRPWDDLDWRSYERLPGNGGNGEGWLSAGATGVDIFVQVKSALATEQNDDDTEINERLGNRLGDMIGRWFQSATAVTEPKGIIRVKSKLDFELMRPIFKVEDVGV